MLNCHAIADARMSRMLPTEYSAHTLRSRDLGLNDMGVALVWMFNGFEFCGATRRVAKSAADARLLLRIVEPSRGCHAEWWTISNNTTWCSEVVDRLVADTRLGRPPNIDPVVR